MRRFNSTRLYSFGSSVAALSSLTATCPLLVHHVTVRTFTVTTSPSALSLPAPFSVIRSPHFFTQATTCSNLLLTHQLRCVHSKTKNSPTKKKKKGNVSTKTKKRQKGTSSSAPAKKKKRPVPKTAPNGRNTKKKHKKVAKKKKNKKMATKSKSNRKKSGFRTPPDLQRSLPHPSKVRLRRAPTLEDVAVLRETESALEHRLATLISKRNEFAKQSYDERRKAVSALDVMKDRYVVLLRQRMLIARAVARRKKERDKLLRQVKRLPKKPELVRSKSKSGVRIEMTREELRQAKWKERMRLMMEKQQQE
eukprot:PhM_4_TR1388/c0_g1_i1/m.12757/K03832/tonB; periplasmic protein TonB